jgi:hypothetical protein
LYHLYFLNGMCDNSGYKCYIIEHYEGLTIAMLNLRVVYITRESTSRASSN